MSESDPLFTPAPRCHCSYPPTRIRSWYAADHFLRHGQWLYCRTWCNNTRILRLCNGDIGVRLHSSTIIVYPHPDGAFSEEGIDALVSLCGWNTPVTRERISSMTHVRVEDHKGFPAMRRWVDHQDHATMGVTGITPFETVALAADCPPIRNFPRSVHLIDESHFHPKARRPYTTTAATGHKYKAKTKHFQGLKFQWSDPAADYKIAEKVAAKKVTAKADSIDGDRVRHELRELVPGLNQIMKCPVGCDEGEDRTPIDQFLSDLLIHLNDNHKWTREQIADWLESLDLDLEFRVTPEQERKVS